METFSAFLNLETGLVCLGVVAVMYFAKGAVTAFLNGNRNRPWVKKQLLPGMAVAIGIGLSFAASPGSVAGLGAKILWGGTVGFFSTAFYRVALSRLFKVPDTAIAEVMQSVGSSLRPPPGTGG